MNRPCDIKATALGPRMRGEDDGWRGARFLATYPAWFSAPDGRFHDNFPVAENLPSKGPTRIARRISDDTSLLFAIYSCSGAT